MFLHLFSGQAEEVFSKTTNVNLIWLQTEKNKTTINLLCDFLAK